MATRLPKLTIHSLVILGEISLNRRVTLLGRILLRINRRNLGLKSYSFYEVPIKRIVMVLLEH